MLRLLHVYELEKSRKTLQNQFLMYLFPESRIKRLNLQLVTEYAYIIFLGVHYLVCFWLWLTNGDIKTAQLPWQKKRADIGLSRVYIFLYYWVIEVITTAGYGDYAGGTTSEYAASLLFEFFGFIIFSVLSLLITQLVKSTQSYQ